MKRLLAILLIIVFTKISFAQTSLSGTAIGLRYDNISNIYSAQTDGKTYIGDLTGNSYTYYVLCVFDLEQLGGVVNKVNSGSVTLRLNQTYGYGGGLWEAGFITQDVSNSSYYDQIVAIRRMSGTQAEEMTSIVLPISMSSIVSNKIIVGVKRVNGNTQELGTWSASIDAVAVPRVTLNVTYNTGTGNIVAYVGPTYSAPLAPASVRALENSQITIAPLTASISNYQLVYNENQAPLNKSSWWIYDQQHLLKPQTLTTATNTFPMLKNEDNWTYEAQMKKLCNATFQNSFGGGTMTVDGISGSAPFTKQVVEQNTTSVTAEQVYFNIDYLDYTFSNWDDGSTYRSKTFTINGHEAHTANYKRSANVLNNFAWDFINIAVGNNIKLQWADHPSPFVTSYKIWRKTKHDSGYFIGTVARGTTTYTDPFYFYASSSDPNRETLFYDVYVYCSLDGGTYTGDGMKLVTGVESLAKQSAGITSESNKLPTEYSIGNFPNPFNPTTTIKYQFT